MSIHDSSQSHNDTEHDGESVRGDDHPRRQAPDVADTDGYLSPNKVDSVPFELGDDEIVLLFLPSDAPIESIGEEPITEQDTEAIATDLFVRVDDDELEVVSDTTGGGVYD